MNFLTIAIMLKLNIHVSTGLQKTIKHHIIHSFIMIGILLKPVTEFQVGEIKQQT